MHCLYFLTNVSNKVDLWAIIVNVDLSETQNFDILVIRQVFQ
jgi:hypothetical protein